LIESHIEWWNSLDDAWKKLFIAHITPCKENDRYSIVDDLFKTNQANILLYTPTHLDLNKIVSLEKIDIINGKSLITSLEPLSRLKDIKYLYVESETFLDISLLSKFRCIEELSLSINHLADLSPLSGLITLKKLWVTENAVSDIYPLRELYNLKDLNLYDTFVNDISPLENLIKIEHLWLAGWSETLELNAISNLKSLKTLYAANTKNADISDISVLFKLPKLEMVVINQVHIRKEDFYKLNSLGIQVSAYTSEGSGFKL